MSIASSPASSVSKASPLRPLFVAGILALWGIPLLAVGAVLMAGHWVALPRPDHQDPNFKRGLQAITKRDSSAKWTLVHVLYTECRCSQKIFDYLFHREHPPRTEEVVLLVGPPQDYAEKARASGFRTLVVSKEELKTRFQIESAPLLMILDETRTPRYLGGYTGRKQGTDYRDLEMLAAIRSGSSTEELPLYGCGVSEELQAYLDPIGVKYSRETSPSNNGALPATPNTPAPPLVPDLTILESD